jgi:phosphate uptake regulator
MPEVRQRFHEELRAVEGEVQQTGAQARLLLEKALGALASGDLGLCGEVIDGDDEVDRLAHRRPSRSVPAGGSGRRHARR